MDSSPPIEDYLPHRAPALLVASIDDHGADWVRCTVRVPAESPFRTGAVASRVPAFLALEMGAQTAATLEGLQLAASSAARAPGAGYVVSARDARFHAPEMPADATFRVDARLAQSAPPLRSYHVEVRVADELFAEATVSTYVET